MFIVVEWLNDLTCLAYTCLNIMHQTLTFAIKYYGQTHKLCNALEKLLLVTSPSSAFGGVTGGDTSQNRRGRQLHHYAGDEDLDREGHPGEVTLRP